MIVLGIARIPAIRRHGTLGSVVPMDVVVNGTPRTVADGLTVAGLVADLGYGERQVVVELNGEPLERERFGDRVLCADDRIEVVRAVAGGAR
jgi:thiamine biosynthesis protein ThiS